MREQLLAHFPSEITATGLHIDLSNSPATWKNKIVELAEYFFTEYDTADSDRFVIAIGGGSGSSKTVSAIALAHIMNAVQSEISVLNVGQDGYHYEQSFLLETKDADGKKLAAHKGRYDTYNVEQLHTDLQSFTHGEAVSFPIYSRKTHNPVQDQIMASERKTILLLEGLWLLYDREPWRTLHR